MANLKSEKQRSRLSHCLMRNSVPTAVLVALATSSAAVQAQQAPAAPADNSIQEVVVTGTMIKRSSAETAEAVTIITADSLKDQGITTVEQALEQISANQQAVNTAASVTSYSGGASLAGLRGLGGTHTLVLLDGQRLADNVTFGAGVDLDTIPFAAIDHIEVLREGASALYGSDAIAGVINFITKKNSQDGELNLNLTHPQHSGGDGGQVDLSFGHGNLMTDGYNLLVTANYTKTGEIQASERNFSDYAFSPDKGFLAFNGPTGTFPGSYLDGATPSNIWQVGYPACTGNPELTTFFGDCGYRYSAATDLVPEQKQYSGLVDFTKTLPGNNQLSIQYFWARNSETQWGGPITYGFEMAPTSPYYPTAAESTCYGTCSTASPVLGGDIIAGWTDPNNNRYSNNTNTEQRVLLTLSGSNGGWDYAGNLVYSQNNNIQAETGGYPNFSVLAPGGVLSDLINPFGPESAAGQALIDSAYLNGPIDTGILKYASASGHASHELGDAFGAGEPATFAFGFEVRDDKIHFQTTPLAVILQPATFFPPTDIAGSQSDIAAYTELNVPVTKQLEFTISDRQDRYSDFGTTNNPKLQIRYQPFDMLTFRGAASTGFRAPSLVQLFSPQVLNATAGDMNGPGCAAAAYTTVFSYTNCTSQGITLDGGNPSLNPEKSQNFDLGIVLSPIADLGVTLDYYRIILKDEIATLPDTTVYGNPTTFSNLYVLNNAGTLTPAPLEAVDCIPYTKPTCGYILLTEQNVGTITTDGVDLSVNYLYRTDFGKFRIGVEGTGVTQFRFQECPVCSPLNLVGDFNQGNQPVIRWQDVFTLDWAYQKFGAGITNTLQTRYVDYQPDGAGNLRNVQTYSLWNTYVSYKPIDNLTVVFGIRNVLDTPPPFSNQQLTFQGYYNPVFSDPTGRDFYLNLKYKFAL
jgi:iron complex outermembrane recepter protein